jgi:hypothetical protein
MIVIIGMKSNFLIVILENLYFALEYIVEIIAILYAII